MHISKIYRRKEVDYMAVKCKNMMFTQEMKYLPGVDQKGLEKLVREKLDPKKFGLIVHDKDVDANGNPVEDHAHIMLSFKNARSINSVAKQLNVKPQYIEKWDGLAENGFAYLVHATEDAKDKFQYSPSEVIANFDYSVELKRIATAVSNSRKKVKANSLLDAFYLGAVTREEVEANMTGTQFGKFSKQLDAIEFKRMLDEAETWRKQKIAENATVKTIWIYGVEGTGKTSLARKLAEDKGDKVFISGSSKDVFQGYKGEHTVILEEMRPFNINYEDLLRITDPHGIGNQVMLPARYKDKPFACDLIIITSPYDPWSYYAEQFHISAYPEFVENNRSTIDKFGQLRRRIDLTICVDMNYTYVAEYNSEDKRYVTVDGSEKKNQYSSKQRPESIIDPVEYYNSLLE